MTLIYIVIGLIILFILAFHFISKRKIRAQTQVQFAFLCKIDSFYAFTMLKEELGNAKVRYKITTDVEREVGQLITNHPVVHIQPPFRPVRLFVHVDDYERGMNLLETIQKTS